MAAAEAALAPLARRPVVVAAPPAPPASAPRLARSSAHVGGRVAHSALRRAERTLRPRPAVTARGAGTEPVVTPSPNDVTPVRPATIPTQEQVAAAVTVLLSAMAGFAGGGSANDRPAAGPVRWLTIEEAGDHAKVAPETVRDWIRKGWLRANPVGRVIRVAIYELDALLRDGAPCPTTISAAGPTKGTAAARARRIVASFQAGESDDG